MADLTAPVAGPVAPTGFYVPTLAERQARIDAAQGGANQYNGAGLTQVPQEQRQAAVNLAQGGANQYNGASLTGPVQPGMSQSLSDQIAARLAPQPGNLMASGTMAPVQPLTYAQQANQALQHAWTPDQLQQLSDLQRANYLAVHPGNETAAAQIFTPQTALRQAQVNVGQGQTITGGITPDVQKSLINQVQTNMNKQGQPFTGQGTWLNGVYTPSQVERQIGVWSNQGGPNVYNGLGLSPGAAQLQARFTPTPAMIAQMNNNPAAAQTFAQNGSNIQPYLQAQQNYRNYIQARKNMADSAQRTANPIPSIGGLVSGLLGGSPYAKMALPAASFLL